MNKGFQKKLAKLFFDGTIVSGQKIHAKNAPGKQ
jgi:hypothetical protein